MSFQSWINMLEILPTLKKNQSITYLPLFFIDLNPAPNIPEIFKLSNVCYSKSKIEESPDEINFNVRDVKTVAIYALTKIIDRGVSAVVKIISMTCMKNQRTSRLSTLYVENIILSITGDVWFTKNSIGPEVWKSQSLHLGASTKCLPLQSILVN